ncbi:MAG: SH3 domain-containing protein, partial [Gemmatimonadales bacterium]
RVPASWAASIALLFWLAACGLAAWRVAHGRLVWSFGVVAGAAIAVVAAWGSVRINEEATAAHLAVAGPGAALHAAPALDAERVSRLDAGDVALVLATHGVWSEVQLDGDREGWIATAQLTSIARRGPVAY